MNSLQGLKLHSYLEFWERLPANEKLIVDILRQIVLENIPSHFTEKLAYNVPYYYGKKRVCMIWPASSPGGGVKKGVLLGFSQGNKLQDKNHYLTHGTNKQVFYKIFQLVDEINEKEIVVLLKEAVKLDGKKS